LGLGDLLDAHGVLSGHGRGIIGRRGNPRIRTGRPIDGDGIWRLQALERRAKARQRDLPPK
jgi:hypothetical protein